MVRLFTRLNQLNFGNLMAVYGESNRENAQERYPEEPLYSGIYKVEQDFYQYLREVFFPVEGAVYCVLSVDAAYVSALRLEPYKDGLLLEALETHPDHRRKGYAVMLIRRVLEVMKEQGITAVYAHVNKRNQASLVTHQKCGFLRISDQAMYIDGSVNSRACTMCFRLHPE